MPQRCTITSPVRCLRNPFRDGRALELDCPTESELLLLFTPSRPWASMRWTAEGQVFPNVAVTQSCILSGWAVLWICRHLSRLAHDMGNDRRTVDGWMDGWIHSSTLGALPTNAVVAQVLSSSLKHSENRQLWTSIHHLAHWSQKRKVCPPLRAPSPSTIALLGRGALSHNKQSK